jgi:NAD(P)-dependent dehydrogenase (short-subunit alcohol dehydrogenase family)
MVATGEQPPAAASNDTPLLGKVYGITGGASGIGLATAMMLSRRGATPCIADIDPKAMDEARAYFTAQEVPFMVSSVDVSQRDQVEAWVESIVKEHGRLDGAANVAGIIGKGHGITPVAELEDSEWHKIIAVNLTGTMYCLRAQLQKIVDGGSIVNVTSVHGLKGTSSFLFSPGQTTEPSLPQVSPTTPATTPASTASSASARPPPSRTATARSASTASPRGPCTRR